MVRSEHVWVSLVDVATRGGWRSDVCVRRNGGGSEVQQEDKFHSKARFRSPLFAGWHVRRVLECEVPQPQHCIQGLGTSHLWAQGIEHRASSIEPLTARLAAEQKVWPIQHHMHAAADAADAAAVTAFLSGCRVNLQVPQWSQRATQAKESDSQACGHIK